MKLSVIIPVYNERDQVETIIRRVLAVPLDKEVIVVDDGSTDGTDKVLAGLAGENVKFIRQDPNQGKGAAIRRAIPEATGDAIIIQDADGEYAPEEYGRLLEALALAPVVYGTRFRDATGRRLWPEKMQPANYAINRLLAVMANVLYGGRITDEATCYKLFRRDVLQGMPLECRRFEFCPEVTAKVLRQGLRIAEVPISYHARTVKEGKKINWKDGVQAIWTLLKYRLRR